MMFRGHWKFLLLLLATVVFCAFFTLLNYIANVSMRLKVLRVPAVSEALTDLRETPFSVPIPAPKIRTHIGFLKVHKAASTTTQAIFLRFGWRRNLTFVLPPEFSAFHYPNIISTNESITRYNTLPPPPGKSFDILCHHVIYNQTSWNSILPKDTAIIGTVREPFALFKSLLNYFEPSYIKTITSADPLTEFLTNVLKYEPKDLRYSMTNNRMALEYGVPVEVILKGDIVAFEEYADNVLKKSFDIVIIAEEFDESLILMKRKLNWTMDDIMYALKNVRPEKEPDFLPVEEKHKALHKQAFPFDYWLYELFKKRLYEQIVAEGPSFYEEVSHFKEARKYVEEFCHAAPLSLKSVTIASSQWNDEFEITKNDCEILHKEEIDFTQDIRKRQYGSASWHWL